MARIEKVELEGWEEQGSRNTHKVPKKQWMRWNEDERIVFNDLYDQMLVNQSVFTHPRTAVMPPDEWKTICWNAAWTAADAMKSLRD